MSDSQTSQQAQASALQHLISAVTGGPTTAGGGTTCLAPWFDCVGQVHGDGMMLGSCVLLRGGRIALTAAHVVRVERRRARHVVRVSDRKQTHVHEVARIHWRSGEVHDARQGDWPAIVGTYFGRLDRLAILELSTPVAHLEKAVAPYLPRGGAPVAGDVLVAAGFGEDPVGNHPASVWTGTARFGALEDSGFVRYAPRRTDPFNGLLAAGGSGGGVFWPPMANPLPPAHLRLVGVHAGRRVEARASSGCYLPIDAAAAEWILRVDAEARSAAAASAKASAAAHGPPRCDFLHRKLLPCFRFPKTPDGIDGVALELTTKGSNRLLVHGSTLTLKVEGSQLRMGLEHPHKGWIEVLLHRDAIDGGGHWYTNDQGGNECYYLFLVDDGAKPAKPGDRRRSPVVHVEAFAAGSAQPRPSACTIWNADGSARPFCPHGEAPDPWDAPAEASAAAVDVQDQDDEGNGHDPP